MSNLLPTQTSSPLTLDPVPETVLIRSSNRKYNIPKEGIVLPMNIIVPQATVSRRTLNDLGYALGLAMPTNLNRVQLIARMIESLKSFGYRSINETTFTRDRPIKLEYMKLLTNDGESAYMLSELVTPDVYIKFLQTPTTVTISQEDLIRLNKPFSSIVESLSRQIWFTFASFIDDFSLTLGVSTELGTMAALSGMIFNESNTTLNTILKSLGSIQRQINPINLIRNYFRSKLQLIPRSYPRRDKFHGDALTTMSFMEAIDQGYRFDDEQYKEDIDNLLANISVPTNHRKFLVEMIQLHPEIVPIMRLYNSNEHTLVTSLIQLYYDEFASEVQLLYAFAVNYPLIFIESEETKARRQQISKLTRPYLHTLNGIYQVNKIELILDKEQHPLELYVFAIAKLPINKWAAIVSGFGMIVPEHLVNQEIKTYILRGMPHYRYIITRVLPVPSISEAVHHPNSARTLFEQLSIYTDQEIISYFGYTEGYDDRYSLIENIYRTIREMGFMIYTELDVDRTLNTETVMLTDIKDLVRPYLVFGTPFIYRVHELDELVQAWTDSDDFRRIDGEGNYTESQIFRLQSLLPLMKNMNSQMSTTIDRLLSRIDEGILASIQRSSKVNIFVHELSRASSTVRNLVREIFYRIFYAGMYMRRWRGPGNRYPLQSNYTRGEPIPDVKVSLTLGELYDQIKQLRQENSALADNLNLLATITYHTSTDNIVIQQSLIFETIFKIFKGKTCIRQASKGLVVSGHYYLVVCFREVIPNFNPYEVDDIA